MSWVSGLKATGLVGIWWQAGALAFAVAPVWLTHLGARLPESTTSQALLMGLVASRFGLWLFDLSVSQMLQECIPGGDIGKHNATKHQYVLCSQCPELHTHVSRADWM